MTAQPITAAGTPAAEVHIDADLVRALLRQQHPDLAALPVCPLDTGWDNAMFRLGDALAVRLPRRAVAAGLIEREQRWLPTLAPHLPLPIPVAQRVGVPGAGFPWPWSVVPWLPGQAADLARPDPSQAEPLADWLRALHMPAPADAPHNPVRGVPLVTRQRAVDDRLARVARLTPWVTRSVRRAWHDALAAPPDDAPCWVHGDLHARNVLVSAGALSAVVDWGDVCRGDRATDLAAVWMLLDDADARARAIRRYDVDTPGLWRRALGWAVSFGAVLLDTGLADHPRHAAMGAATLRNVDDDVDVVVDDGPHDG